MTRRARPFECGTDANHPAGQGGRGRAGATSRALDRVPASFMSQRIGFHVRPTSRLPAYTGKNLFTAPLPGATLSDRNRLCFPTSCRAPDRIAGQMLSLSSFW